MPSRPARPPLTDPASETATASPRLPWALWPSPLDALPAALNHLLDAEPWARAQLAPHRDKTLFVVVAPFTIALAVGGDGRVSRAAASAVADTTVTLSHAAVLRAMTSGAAPMQDLRIDGNADFAQAVSMLARHLRWDVEEDLSKVVGDIAAHRAVDGVQRVRHGLRRGGERLTAGIAEYLLEENPQLVYPRAIAELGAGVRTLRDDLARLEKRIERLAVAGPGSRA